MNFNGLSLDQAPPISAPLRFFLTAPIFAIIAGVLIFFADSNSLLSRFSVESVVVAHTLTIGFLAFIMLGALTQMLPVLAGVKIPRIELVANSSYTFLVLGLIAMLFGLHNSNTVLNIIAFVLLGSGFLIIISAISIAVLKIKNFTATVKAMGISLFFALFVVLMGLFLLSSYIFEDMSPYHLLVANIHSVWGVFGFAGILIIGVAFQVLPMFYVAPRFKKFCKTKVIWLIPTGLILWAVSNIFDIYLLALVAKIWVVTFFTAFATAAWIKISSRKRPVIDITIWYWKSAIVFLISGALLWLSNDYTQNDYTVLISLMIGAGFIMSIMLGMLYKIVPFLVWFHLNGMGYMSIPTMNEMIDKRFAKTQYTFYIISILGFMLTYFIPGYLEVFAIIFILSMILFQYNLICAVSVYVKTKKKKPDFDMSSFAIEP